MIILYHKILVILYDGHPYSIVHVYFSWVVKTICLSHFTMDRPFWSCIHNVIFSNSYLKTVLMYGYEVLVFLMWSIAEFFQLSFELQLVMHLQPLVLFYCPYTVVLCKHSSYNLVQMQFHAKWMMYSSIPWRIFF